MKSTHKNKTVINATKAATQIRTIESALDLEDVTDAELEKANRYGIVPTEALEVVASFLKQHGDRFRQYDATEAQRAWQYEASMKEVADAARQLANRIDRSILKNRFAAVPQVLSFYAVLQATKRTDGSVRDVVDRLAPLVSTRKRGRRRSASAKAAGPQPAATPAAPNPPVKGVSPGSPGATSSTNGAAVTNGASTNGASASNGGALTNGIAH